MNYATFWQRLAAAIIDSIIVQIGISLLSFAVGLVYGLLGGGSGGAGALGVLIGLLGSWLYYALMESSAKQATLGKMAMSIYVTDLNGNKLTFGKATVRHFGKILSSLILLIGYLMVAFTEKKQALHDQLAGALVVQG